MPRLCGEDWLEHYLVAPAWHFMLPAGVWSPFPLAGTAIPSVDRVGRYFPLAVLTGLDAAQAAAECVVGLAAWQDAASGCLLRALQEGLTPDALQAALAMLDPDAAAQRAVSAAGGDVFSILGEQHADAVGGAAASQDSAWPELAMLFQAQGRASYWWSVPTPAQEGRRVVHSGAPDVVLFTRLFGATCQPES